MTGEIVPSSEPVAPVTKTHPASIVIGVVTALAGALLLTLGERGVSRVFADDTLLGEQRIKSDGTMSGLAILLIAIGVATSLLARKPFPRSVLAGLITAGAGFIALVLIGIRTEKGLGLATRTEFTSSGWLIVASLLLLVAVAVVMVIMGNHFTGTTYGTASLTLGILSLLFVPLAPAAIITGRARGQEGRRANTGTAGLVLGIVAMSLWLGGLTIAALVASP